VGSPISSRSHPGRVGGSSRHRHVDSSKSILSGSPRRSRSRVRPRRQSRRSTGRPRLRAASLRTPSGRERDPVGAPRDTTENLDDPLAIDACVRAIALAHAVDAPPFPLDGENARARRPVGVTSGIRRGSTCTGRPGVDRRGRRRGRRCRVHEGRSGIHARAREPLHRRRIAVAGAERQRSDDERSAGRIREHRGSRRRGPCARRQSDHNYFARAKGAGPNASVHELLQPHGQVRVPRVERVPPSKRNVTVPGGARRLRSRPCSHPTPRRLDAFLSVAGSGMRGGVHRRIGATHSPMTLHTNGACKALTNTQSSRTFR